MSKVTLPIFWGSLLKTAHNQLNFACNLYFVPKTLPHNLFIFCYACCMYANEKNKVKAKKVPPKPTIPCVCLVIDKTDAVKLFSQGTILWSDKC